MDFLNLLWALISGYVINGFVFLLLHVLVVVLIRNSWRRIDAEAEVLNKWAPHDARASSVGENLSRAYEESSTQSGTTEILDQFVYESSKLGKQGLFVPITDFSDRLDSTVDGMLAELNDRTNLFLIVGIAGTLFGVFEFAFKSYTTLAAGALPPGERVLKLGEFLSGSMSKAFPVGFMGLALTFFSQALAARPERKLRKALSGATRKALWNRQETSKSQAEVIRAAVEAIKEGMRPLNELRATLTQSVQPVIEVFGTRLEQSLRLVEVQFEKLQETTAGLQSAVDGVHTGVSSLQTAADSLQTLTKDTPEVLRGIVELQGAQVSSFDKYNEVFDTHITQARQINVALNTAVEGVQSLKKEIVSETKSAFEEISRESIANFSGTSETMHRQLKAGYDTLINNADERINEILKALTLSITGLEELTKNASSTMRSLTELPDGVLNSLSATFGQLKGESLRLWGDMSGEFGRGVQNSYVSFLSSVEGETKSITTSLQEAAGQWQRVAVNAESILKDPITQVINDAKTEITGGLTSLETSLMSRVPQLSGDIETLAGSLSGIQTRVESVQTAFDFWFNGAVKAQGIVNDIHASLSGVLGEIQRADLTADRQKLYDMLQESLREIRRANLRLEQLSVSPTGDGTPPGGERGEQEPRFFDRLFNRK